MRKSRRKKLKWESNILYKKIVKPFVKISIEPERESEISKNIFQFSHRPINQSERISTFHVTNSRVEKTIDQKYQFFGYSESEFLIIWFFDIFLDFWIDRITKLIFSDWRERNINRDIVRKNHLRSKEKKEGKIHSRFPQE